MEVDEQCFYCELKFEDQYSHGLFVYQNEQVDKPLCLDCYKDWLEGMKG